MNELRCANAFVIQLRLESDSASDKPAAGPKDGYALLGAIVETVTPTFFKLTGPEKTVNAAKADFDKFIDSLRPK